MAWKRKHPCLGKKKKLTKRYVPKSHGKFQAKKFRARKMASDILEKKSQAQFISTFATDNPHANTPGMANKGRKTAGKAIRKHSPSTIRYGMSLLKGGMSNQDVAKQLGVPWVTVRNWKHFANVKPEKLKVLRDIVTLAHQMLSKSEILDTRSALYRACSVSGFPKSSIGVYVCFEALPVPPGFNLYADPQSQARCEAAWAGQRTSGSPLGQVVKPARAEPRMREALRQKKRRKRDYAVSVSSTLSRR